VHSKNQCTLENGEEDKEFDEAVVMRVIARVVVGGVLKPKPARGHYLQSGIESKGVDTLTKQ